MSESYQDLVCGWLAFSIGSVSLVCSMTTLYLIFKMKQWNGYMLLLTSLVCCQIPYDIGHILEIGNSFAVCLATKFFNYVSGLSVAFWTNIISYIVLYVTLKSRSINIYANYKYFFTIAVFPALILSIVVVSTPNMVHFTKEGSCYYTTSLLSVSLYQLYYWGRLFSIITNFVIVSFITWYLYVSSDKQGSSGTAHSTTRRQVAVYTLVNRMKYYPLVQAVCRSGAAWNEWRSYSGTSFASYVMASVLSPLTGTAYFVVFLIMQPNALKTLLELLDSLGCAFCTTARRPDESAARDSDVRFGGRSTTVMRPSESPVQLAANGSRGSQDTRSLTEDQLEAIINGEAADDVGSSATMDGLSLPMSSVTSSSYGVMSANRIVSPIHRNQTLGAETELKKEDRFEEEKEKDVEKEDSMV